MVLTPVLTGVNCSPKLRLRLALCKMGVITLTLEDLVNSEDRTWLESGPVLFVTERFWIKFLTSLGLHLLIYRLKIMTDTLTWD